MRWYIVRTLLLKDILRHLAERGAIFLMFLLIAAMLLLTLFGNDEANGGPLLGGVRECYVDYWEKESPWIDYLWRHPPKTKLNVKFRTADQIPTDDHGVYVYQQSTGAIQVWLNGSDESGRPRYRILLWHPGKDPAVLAPYVRWFWQTTFRYFQSQKVPVEIATGAGELIDPGDATLIRVRSSERVATARGESKSLYWHDEQLPPPPAKPVEIEVEDKELRGHGDLRLMVATGLIYFGLCFFSIFLLPSLTCEERERGVLLAQVLTPASTGEMLAAKFLFYPALGMALAGLLAGIYRPPVLLRPFFWLCLVTTAVGYLGAGLTIASLARTQRMASMGALCYMLTVALLLFITERFGIPSVQYLALEYYCSRAMHAALDGTIMTYHWFNLGAAMVLALAWGFAASVLFRKYGWQ